MLNGGETKRSGAKIFPCPFCSEKFVDKDMISEHVMQSHASWDVGDQTSMRKTRAPVQLREKSSSSRVFACPHCDLVFKKHNLLLVHMHTHPDPLHRRRVAGSGMPNVHSLQTQL